MITQIFFVLKGKNEKKTFLLFLQIKHIWYGMEVNNIFKTWSLVEDWLSPAARTLSRFYCPPAEINSRRWTISIYHTKQHKYLWCLKKEMKNQTKLIKYVFGYFRADWFPSCSIVWKLIVARILLNSPFNQTSADFLQDRHYKSSYQKITEPTTNFSDEMQIEKGSSQRGKESFLRQKTVYLYMKMFVWGPVDNNWLSRISNATTNQYQSHPDL